MCAALQRIVFVTLSVQNKTNHSAQTSLSVIWCRSSDDGEGGAVPAPSVVDDNVGRVGDEWSVVCVELARLVGRTVVARVTDRRHGAVGQAVETMSNVGSARHLVNHSVSSLAVPNPTCKNILS